MLRFLWRMRLSRVFRGLGIMVGVALAGCAGTKENLEKRGIEIQGGKVRRVFRF